LSTECGTVYTKAELSSISSCCRKNGLYLYLDGARLGPAINSVACDLSYRDIADLTDVFFIGGTKTGALFGEAIVICNDKLKDDFRFSLKQRGALIAKGAALGVQFQTLFADGLYDELAMRSNAMAIKLADGIKTLGYEFLFPVETNIIIPVFPVTIAKKLHELYGFHDWKEFDDMLAVRLVSSWAAPESTIDEFIADLSVM